MTVKLYCQGCVLGMTLLRTHRRVKDYHCQRREAPVCSHWRIDRLTRLIQSIKTLAEELMVLPGSVSLSKQIGAT